MIGLVSDVGLKRKLNEDSACYLERQNFKIYVVADGMGGHNAGEVASKMAAEQIVQYVDENYCSQAEETLISKAIKAANEEIYKFSKTNDKLNGMGTTVTACLVTSKSVYVANVGDSSCMALKNGKLEKITKDHSLVQELLDSGTISEFEAKNHPKKNIITRALGTSMDVDVDVFKIRANEYELFILCSDGLTNEVTNDEILRIIYNESNYVSIANDLVNLAKEKGGRDNITVLLFGGEM
ncbi:Stp1/IreP family PP2C-type Ser/Thr phosphatase [uncultured Clostridium sp.]|uniref:Stp1/IreP family PP2C-type Ser/Thr phosphatase n=1 Tax=uncultured Clostridium sp. TaxID=59620 RepID=UPI0025EF6367|nr:Stp1/IreP family PP2C-type Ser/Thr phosphatase [uncultured Clostridium sp.]